MSRQLHDPDPEARPRCARRQGRGRSRPTEGFSLVEVLAAIGLIGGVIVIVAGLLAVGARSVHSGRQMTTAVALGKTVMEEVLAWPYGRVWEQTGGAVTSQTATWSTDLANPAFTGSIDAAELTATCDAWREAASELPDGVLSYQVDGLIAPPTATSDGLTAYSEARLLRVIVVISWTEMGKRPRSVQFEEWKL